MVLTRRAQKFIDAPRLPVELLTEIAKQAPKSSLWALCRTSRVFHDLTVRDLYRDVLICCTASYAADTKALIRRAQKWCHTVMEKPDKAALIKSVTVTKLPHDRIKYPAQAYELTALLKRAFETLPNLESLNIDCIFAPTEGSLEILDALRLPSLRTFRIEMDSVHAPTLIDFLSNHPLLKDIELITDGYGNDEPDEELVFEGLERFTAPFTYWELVWPTPTLRFAGIHQDLFTDLADDPVDVIWPLKEFTGIRSVKIVVPAKKTIRYLLSLEQELPELEELSVDFSNWVDHGDVTNTNAAVAGCLKYFNCLQYISVESEHWNANIDQDVAMVLAGVTSEQCKTLLRARFGAWELERDGPESEWRIVQQIKLPP